MPAASSVSFRASADPSAAEKSRQPEADAAPSTASERSGVVCNRSGRRCACVLPAPAGLAAGQVPAAELPILHSVRRHRYCPHRALNGGSARALLGLLITEKWRRRLAAAGVSGSVRTVGDAYDNALAESVIGLFKTELIKPRGPWRTAEQVELATLEYVDWFNHRRLYEACGDIPPAELETAYYRQNAALAEAGQTTT
jgi:Integrase core domain